MDAVCEYSTNHVALCIYKRPSAASGHVTPKLCVMNECLCEGRAYLGHEVSH